MEKGARNSQRDWGGESEVGWESVVDVRKWVLAFRPREIWAVKLHIATATLLICGFPSKFFLSYRTGLVDRSLFAVTESNSLQLLWTNTYQRSHQTPSSTLFLTLILWRISGGGLWCDIARNKENRKKEERTKSYFSKSTNLYLVPNIKNCICVQTATLIRWGCGD